MTETIKQLWQDKIIVDILNSDDGKYNKEYTLPRGSGSSTLFLRLLREFNIIFRDEDVKILMIVPTKNHKRFVQSFVSSATSNMFANIAALTGQQLPDENQVMIVAADENPEIVMKKYTMHIDWLLADGIDEDNAILTYMKALNINNSLIMRTY